MAGTKASSDPTYLDGSGAVRPLDTADDLSGAVSDLGNRLAAIETAPRDSGGSGIPARYKHVLDKFFGNDLADYDRSNPEPGAGN